MWRVDQSFCVCCSRFHLLHHDRPSINSTVFGINSHIWKLGVHASAFLSSWAEDEQQQQYLLSRQYFMQVFLSFFLKFIGFGILRNVTERLTSSGSSFHRLRLCCRSASLAGCCATGNPWRSALETPPVQRNPHPHPHPHFPLMEGPEPYGMRRMPLRVRRPFVLEQETI